MTREVHHKKTDQPERMCLVTRETAPKNGLIRFVTDPDGVVVVDVLAKLPGRGFYVSANKDVLAKAIKTKAFAKGAKSNVTVPANLAEQVEAQLVKRVIDLISLARKAGLAITGFEKVKAALSERGIRVLLQASDGSERGKEKLWTPEGARYFGCLTSDELGLAFGRGHAIHCALSTGRLSERVVEDATRLLGLRAPVAEKNGASSPSKGR